MILLIDNYDSFSYNLYQLVGEFEPNIWIIRNDEMTAEEIRALQPERIILSPGPGRPEDAGITMEVVTALGHEIPILGVCLGHQAICAAFGASITYAKALMHGKQSQVRFDLDCPLFRGCPETALVGRYHSLAADAETLPECLKITARTEDGEVMAVQHRAYPIYGVQFHPESILTPDGKTMLQNFIKGKAGIAITNAYGLKATGYFSEMNPNDVGFTYIPKYDDKTKAYTTGLFRGWGLIRGSKNPVAAGLFLRYYLDVNNYNTSSAFINSAAESFFFKITSGVTTEKKNLSLINGTRGVTGNATEVLGDIAKNDPCY